MLIFNADDYCLTEVDTFRIEKSFDKGIIKSATIVANKDLNLSKKYLNQNISLGAHINLVEGVPITSAKSLVDTNGNFLNKYDLFRKIIKNQVSRLDIEQEVYHQLKILVDNGINISHIDTHQNTHIIPIIANSIIKVCKHFNINKIRPQRIITSWFNGFNFKSYIMYLYNPYWKKSLDNCFITPDRLIIQVPGLGYEIDKIDVAVKLWDLAINKKYNKNIVYEIPCHLYLSKFEYELYNSKLFVEMLSSNKIVIGNYHDI